MGPGGREGGVIWGMGSLGLSKEYTYGSDIKHGGVKSYLCLPLQSTTSKTSTIKQRYTSAQLSRTLENSTHPYIKGGPRTHKGGRTKGIVDLCL